MKMPEEPKCPEPSPEVIEWFATREPPGVVSFLSDIRAKLGNDMPPHVLAYCEAHEAWQVEHDAWRTKRPIDYDPLRNRLRFFGGDWLDSFSTFPGGFIEGMVGERREVVGAYNSILRAYERMDEPTFRVFIARIYEHLRTERTARDALVKHLLPVEP